MSYRTSDRSADSVHTSPRVGARNNSVSPNGRRSRSQIEKENLEEITEARVELERFKKKSGANLLSDQRREEMIFQDQKLIGVHQKSS